MPRVFFGHCQTIHPNISQPLPPPNSPLLHEACFRRGHNAQSFFRAASVYMATFSLFNFLLKHHHYYELGPFKLNSNTLSTCTFNAPQLKQTKSLEPSACFLQTPCSRVKRTQSFGGIHMAEPRQNDAWKPILFFRA